MFDIEKQILLQVKVTHVHQMYILYPLFVYNYTKQL